MKLSKYFTPKKLISLVGLGLALWISYILYFLTICNKKFPSPDPYIKVETNEPILTHEEAINRSNIISNVSYSLFLYLSTEDYFKGEVLIFFTIKELSDNLFLDFNGASISTFKINGEKLTKNFLFSQGRLFVHKDYQRLGVNQISIKYLCTYSKDGEGMHKYKDLRSSQTFIYTHFEPYQANRVLPNFDQPNLKATFKITILAKDDWVVASNENVLSKYSLQAEVLDFLLNHSQFSVDNELDSLILKGGLSLTNFKETPSISTYILCIIAGNYLSINYNKTDFPIPMTIYFREPLQKYINKVSSDIFDLTKEGIKYFTKTFSHNFPFPKYDQIFVPEFNAGAMENAGIITFNEMYIQKETLNKMDYGLLGEVVIHELSHMWFGNLVTLEWWDDTWLNEAMATFMTIICIEESKNLEKYKEEKVLSYIFLTIAYSQDQMPTNHKITALVNHTDEARIIFDFLTYEKGATIIMQLYKAIGKDSFRYFISRYINKYKWSNANRNDFISSFHDSSSKFSESINQWFDEWIETKGINLLIPKIEMENKTKVITKFQILQKSQEYSDRIYRNFYIDLLIVLNSEIDLKILDKINNSSQYSIKKLVSKNESENRFYNEFIISNISINKSNLSEIQKLVLENIVDPKLLLLNPEGNTYMLSYLDESTLKNILDFGILPNNNLHKISIFQSLINMVKDMMTPANKVILWLINYINQEKDLDVLTFIFKKLPAIIYRCTIFEDHSLYGDIVSAKMYNFLSKEKDPIYADIYAKFLIAFSDTNFGKGFILKIFENKEEILNLLDTKIKHSLISKIFSLESVSIEYKNKLMDEYILNDKTGLAEMSKKSCEASLPDLSYKEKVWGWYNNETLNSSVRIYESSMTNFLTLNNYTFLKYYAKRFSENVIRIFKIHDKIFSSEYFESLSPFIADNETLILFLNLMANISTSDSQLYKNMQERIYEMNSSIKCIEFNEMYKKK